MSPSVEQRAATPEPLWERVSGGRLPLVLVGLAAVTVLLRLPYVGTPVSADEGGFLVVGGQWHSGSSLYGQYWVDRPPLLIALFKLADVLGGLTALRLLGCLAAALTLLGIGLAARRVAGPAAAAASGIVACALLVSPGSGSLMVNGELLAAPFVAVGCWLAVCAVTAGSHARSSWQAVGAGACAAAAVLVKQNMIDVIVFAVPLGLLCWGFRLVPFRELARVAAWFAAGGVVTAALVMGVALTQHTGPGGVFYAMYSFRLQATGVVAHGSMTQRLARLSQIGRAALLSGAPLLPVALAAVLVRRSTRPRGHALAVALSTLALTAYAVFSVVAGGSYFLHYLVELVVPTSLAAGLVVVGMPRLGRVLCAVVLGVALVLWTTGLTEQVEVRGETAGRSVRAVAAPGDTMVVVFGEADMLQSARMASPYAYLWALPARTLDPGYRKLGAVLSGRRAPTWFAIRGASTVKLIDRRAPGDALRRRYHYVATICDRRIYLRDGVRRPTPTPVAACSRAQSPWFG